jgi:type III pantothenate kinase
VLPYFVLLIGNSHCHWAWVEDNESSRFPLVFAWDTSPFPDVADPLDLSAWLNFCVTLWRSPVRGTAPPAALVALERSLRSSHFTDANQLNDSSFNNSPLNDPTPLYYASVVPTQTARFSVYPKARRLTLTDIPLGNMYETLGIDRALALWAAGEQTGWPTIVIDGGTALTVTGADNLGQLVGGAILPGVGLQFRSLAQNTAALPWVSMSDRPLRWARNPADAMRSGIYYTILAGVQSFLQNWLEEYPSSSIYFTGGDGQWLFERLSPIVTPSSQPPIHYRSDLALQGIINLVSSGSLTDLLIAEEIAAKRVAAPYPE